MAKVTVDHEYFLILDSQTDSAVHRQEGLTGSRVERGSRDHIGGRILGHELEVRPKDSEGLVDGVTVAVLNNNGVGAESCSLDPAEDVLLLGGQRKLAEERKRKALEILAGVNLGVGGHQDVLDGERDQEAEKKGHKHDPALLRSNRAVDHRVLDHTGVVGGESLGELILLTLLEKVEVEALLDALLTLDAEQLVSLLRVGGNLRGSGPGLALEAAVAGVESHDLVVHGHRDSASHRLEGLVHILDQHVVLTGVLDEVVPLDELAVIFIDPGLKSGIGYAHIRRQGLVVAALIGDVVLDITGHVELVVQLLHLLVDDSVLLHVHVGGGSHVGDHVGRLVSGDVGIDIGELTLDHIKTVIDELGGRPRKEVFVLDPLDVVDGDQGADDVLSPLGGDIIDTDGDHVSHLIGLGDSEMLAEKADSALPGRTSDIYVKVVTLLRIAGSLGHQDPSERGRESVAKITLDRITVELVLGSLKIRKGDLAVLLERDTELGFLVVRMVKQLSHDRKSGPVEGDVVATAGILVVHVELQVLDDISHDVGRTEGAELIVNVGSGHEHAHVGKLARVVDGAATRIGLDLYLG